VRFIETKNSLVVNPLTVYYFGGDSYLDHAALSSSGREIES
jgi:hypothetical protein